MDKIKVGLASYGLSGQVFHAPFLQANPRFELVAILERTKNLSAERYPATKIVRSFDELLAEDVELVVVNTPNDTHVDFVTRALEAGKHVVVEKPVTATVAEAEQLMALAREKNLTLSVYQNRRWDGDFLTVKKVIESGELGELVEYEAVWPRCAPAFRTVGGWREEPGPAAGVLYDLGAHLIDQALQLFGEPAKVLADVASMRDAQKANDYFCLHLLGCEHAPSVHVTLKSSCLMGIEEPRFLLHGTQGSLIKYGLDPQEAASKAGVTPDSDDWGEEEPRLWALLRKYADDGSFDERRVPTITSTYSNYYNNLYDHIRSGAPLLSDISSTLGTLRVIEKALALNS